MELAIGRPCIGQRQSDHSFPLSGKPPAEVIVVGGAIIRLLLALASSMFGSLMRETSAVLWLWRSF